MYTQTQLHATSPTRHVKIDLRMSTHDYILAHEHGHDDDKLMHAHVRVGKSTHS